MADEPNEEPIGGEPALFITEPLVATSDEINCDYSAVLGEIECEVAEEDVVFLPNNAIQLNDQLYDKAEFDSCSDRDDLDLIDNEEDPTLLELASAFWQLGLDFDCRAIDKDHILFTDKEEAGQFTPMVAYGRPVEIPCKVLFDYHSGYTCMDMTVLAGDVFHVCAEEHQVLLIGREDDEEWQREGFPTGFYRSWKYSLGRRENPTRALYSTLGLIPSSYLVPVEFYERNRPIFTANWWWLGVCSFDDAFTYLTMDRYAQVEGLFVIFSPRWLNLGPGDYRPYVLMTLSRRHKETERLIAEMGEMFGTNILHTDLEALQNRTNLEALKQLKGHEIPSSYRGEGAPVARIKRRRAKKNGDNPKQNSNSTSSVSVAASNVSNVRTTDARNATTSADFRITPEKNEQTKTKKKSSFQGAKLQIGEQTILVTAEQDRAKDVPTGLVPDEEETFNVPEPSLEDFIHAGTSAFAIQTYAIKRSALGHYELMDRRYTTLYDLVWDLSHNKSHMPCQLVVDGFNVPPPFPVTPMEPPPHHKSPHGLNMNCEQWAARHYKQATEPAFWQSPLSYCIRSFVNPLKDRFWRMAGYKDDDVVFNMKAFKNLNVQAKTNDEKEKQKQLDAWLFPPPPSKPDKIKPPPPPPTDENPKPSPPPNFEIPKEEHAIEIDPKIVIPGHCLKIHRNQELGSGHFGKVYKGDINLGEGWKKCVVKEFHVLQTDKNEEMLAFAEELDISCALNHPNVVGFYGARIFADKASENTEKKDISDSDERDREDGGNPQGAVGGNTLCIVHLAIELCMSSLEGYLKKRNEKEKSVPTNNELIDWMSQAARGLSYLHTRVPAIAHGDFAIRNILVAQHPYHKERFVIKVTDFGLAKFMRPDSARPLYGAELPMEHLPPECRKRKDLSPAADVWSFGCTLYELYVPSDRFVGVLASGGMIGYRKEEKPEQMPIFIYTLFLMCLRLRPHDRISMDAADKYLQSHWIESEGEYLNVVYGGRRG